MPKVQQTIIKACLLAALMSAVWECDVTTANPMTQDLADFYNPKGAESQTEIDFNKKDLHDNMLVSVNRRSLSMIAECREDNNTSEWISGSYSKVCLTKSCIEAAARINRCIDYSADYCENFYQFACGNWVKYAVILDGKSKINMFEIQEESVGIILKSLLQAADKPGDLESIKKAKIFYKSCMNTQQINSRGGQPLKNLLTQEFGGWPLTTPGWLEGSFDFLQTMLKLNSYGLKPVIFLYVNVDLINSSRSILSLEQTDLALQEYYYQEGRNSYVLMAYEDFIFNIGQMLGFADPNTARQEVTEIVDFEYLLTNISLPFEEQLNRQALYNPMTLAEVHGNYSQVIDWRTYVQSLFSKPEIGVTDITDNETIINYSKQYYQKLNDLMAVTPKRTLANYLMWRLVYSVIHYLNDTYISQFDTFEEATTGSVSKNARFRICNDEITGYLGLVVSKLYIRENFDPEAKTMALELVNVMKNSFNVLLDNQDWMDEATRSAAKDKSMKMTAKVGYPDEVINDTYLEEYYKNYTFNKEHYFENHLVTQREIFHNEMKELRKVIDKNKWDVVASQVNAYFADQKNQILLPAAVLQPPFFNKGYPKYLNYGGIGMFIGHELIHGFDGYGRNFDSEGNTVNWWSQSAEQSFNNKSSCFVQHYKNITDPEFKMNVQGKRSENENIADHGGLKRAYQIYKDWTEQQGEQEPRLPTLNFNPNQLFFINYAQIWCSKMTKAETIRRLKRAVHLPSYFRVTGTIQNNPDFARVFNCSSNSKMNPETKCSLW